MIAFHISVFPPECRPNKTHSICVELNIKSYFSCEFESRQTVVVVTWYNTLQLTFGLWHLFLFSVAHHDPENTFNCSFIEPPSVAEQPSPSSWSSQESFSSFESGDEGPVYCLPHEGESQQTQINSPVIREDPQSVIDLGSTPTMVVDKMSCDDIIIALLLLLQREFTLYYISLNTKSINRNWNSRLSSWLQTPDSLSKVFWGKYPLVQLSLN